MELLVILSLFIGLAILAVRYGYDSRDRLRSAEELLGAQGLAWGSQADPNAATPRRARPGGTAARHHHHRPTAGILSTFL